MGSESAEALASYDRNAEEITAELKKRSVCQLPVGVLCFRVVGIGEAKFNALRHYDGITHKHMMALPKAVGL